MAYSIATQYDMLSWIAPLAAQPLVWRETGSAGGLRAVSTLTGRDDHAIEYLNLVTACALARVGKAYHSGEWHAAAEAMRMPSQIASAMVLAGDNNLPESNKYFVTLTKLVEFLANGGNLLKD